MRRKQRIKTSFIRSVIEKIVNYTFAPLPVFIVLNTATVMEKEIESVLKIEETGSYLQLSFNRAPKKNQEALAQLGKRWVQWLNKHGVSSKIYYLNNNNNSTTTTSEEVPGA